MNNHKEIPILMSTPMVVATIAGVKKETRRLITNRNTSRIQPGDLLWVRETFKPVYYMYWDEYDIGEYLKLGLGMPPFSPAKPPYVSLYDSRLSKEVLLKHHRTLYKADSHSLDKKYKPSIHMPKTACRLFLRVTDVDTHFLIDMDHADRVNEGVELLEAYRNIQEKGIYKYQVHDYFKYQWTPDPNYDETESMLDWINLWNSINKREGTRFRDNPKVKCIKYKVEMLKPLSYH